MADCAKRFPTPRAFAPASAARRRTRYRRAVGFPIEGQRQAGALHVDDHERMLRALDPRLDCMKTRLPENLADQ
jgi:hypothetical protein